MNAAADDNDNDEGDGNAVPPAQQPRWQQKRYHGRSDRLGKPQQQTRFRMDGQHKVEGSAEPARSTDLASSLAEYTHMMLKKVSIHV